MPRKRITEVLPFLLPLRKWQRKKLFYLKMQMDGSRYAKSKAKALLPYKVYETSSLMMNANSGFDMKYQRNKVHNLKLSAHLTSCQKENVSFGLIAILSIVVAANFRLCTLFL